MFYQNAEQTCAWALINNKRNEQTIVTSWKRSNCLVIFIFSDLSTVFFPCRFKYVQVSQPSSAWLWVHFHEANQLQYLWMDYSVMISTHNNHGFRVQLHLRQLAFNSLCGPSRLWATSTAILAPSFLQTLWVWKSLLRAIGRACWVSFDMVILPQTCYLITHKKPNSTSFCTRWLPRSR